MGEVKDLLIEIEAKITELKDLRAQNTPKETLEKLERHIWDLSKKKFSRDIKEKMERAEIRGYKGIIFTVGFSKEPIILNIMGFQPVFCFFIHSRESEHVLNDIIAETKLKPVTYQRVVLEKNSAAETYDAVKKGLRYLRFEKELKDTDIALDPTGGTKAMSVGCGIATNTYNIDLLYVDNTNYDVVLRRPHPGSEQIVNVVNPFQIYYDDIVLEGLKMLRTFSFEAARSYFLDAGKNARDPLIPQILQLLVIGLHKWDLFDHKKAQKNLTKALDLIGQYQKLTAIKPIVKRWLAHLALLSETKDVYFNGNRMRQREQFDNAAMRYYRAIEMSSQYILRTQYHLDTQNADYTNMRAEKLDQLAQQRGCSKEALILEKYNEIWAKLFEVKGIKQQFKPNSLLPLKIGLINGMVLRLIVEDPALDLEFLFKIFNAIENRNNSILAHGLKPINKKDCDTLKSICTRLITPFLDRHSNLKKIIFNQDHLLKIHEIVHREL
ncbi:MAG: TIGR02710 family CRISPR-associated CARF protein [Candidatus Helarchaeota archaeon]